MSQTLQSNYKIMQKILCIVFIILERIISLDNDNRFVVIKKRYINLF